MFDNTNTVNGGELDRKLRQNLQGFNRDSLRILHPVFVDALRLLARRDQPVRRDTLLLPLAWPGARPLSSEAGVADAQCGRQLDALAPQADAAATETTSGSYLSAPAGKEEYGFITHKPSI